MKEHFVISAVGENITGIVSAVSREVYECGCDFQDSVMTFLERHFCLMALITGNKEGMQKDLQARCERLCQESNLRVALLYLGKTGDAPRKGPAPNYEIRVKGINRMGIVYRTSQLLASWQINIVEMETSLEPPYREGDPPEFSMRVAVVIPESANTGRLRKSLEALAEDPEDTILFNPI